MKAAPFAYERADSVDHAVGLLAAHGEEAKLIAGGQSLAAMMNLRLARPAVLVDVNRVPGLAYVTADGESLRIGALTRHQALEHYPVEIPRFSVLQRTAPMIGHVPIRTRGTFGGSLAHADPAAEWCILALLLDAQILAVSPRGRRSIPAREFFRGFLTTALAPDEMIVEARFSRGATHAALSEFSRRAGDFAVAAAAVAMDVVEGLCTGVRIVLGGVADTPVRAAAAEAVLEGQPADPEAFRAAAAAAAAGVEPTDSLHGSREYKRALVRGLVVRACEQAVQEGGAIDGRD